VRPRVSDGVGRPRGAPPGVRGRAGRYGRAADAHDANRGDTDREGRSVGHRGVLHARRKLSGAVWPRRPQWLHRRRPADLAPDPLPRRPEDVALRIGWAYEQASDWKTRRPPEP